MTLSLEQRIDLLETRLALVDLTSDYCHGFDKRDLDRFPKLQEVLVIEESYARGTKDTWLLTHADPAKKPDPSLFIVPEKHRHRPERKAADDDGE